jgi:hypothetical protein
MRLLLLSLCNSDSNQAFSSSVLGINCLYASRNWSPVMGLFPGPDDPNARDLVARRLVMRATIQDMS